MSDYQPLDLTPLCNASADLLGPDGAATLGPQAYRGVPFLIGHPASAQLPLIGHTGHTAPVTIQVGQTAPTLVFAHVLVDAQLHASGLPGDHVATYVIHYADGQHTELPIRERFEIGWLTSTHDLISDVRSPGAPFVAMPDVDDELVPRHTADRDQMGRALTEVNGGVAAKDFYLWPWRNPRPDVPIQHVEFRPTDRRIILGGLCLGHVDEDPFRRAARRAVVIELPEPEDANAPFDLEVNVERGIATFPHPITRDPAEFLASDTAGFGEPRNDSNSPAYTEIAGVPSAQIHVSRGEDELGAARLSDLEGGQPVDASPRLRLRLAEQGRNWVHTRVVDDATGQPLPCRVHFRSPEGVPYQPHGHHNHLNTGHDTWHTDVGGDLRMDQAIYAYIDGRCQGWLPVGKVQVDAACGFEYEPLRTELEIKPGQRELELRLRRWSDPNARGWYSGDTHVHFLSGDGANLEAAGEGLNVVNVLASQWGSLFTNTEDFIGRPRVSDDGRTIVYVSQENRQHFLGHLTLLGLKEAIMPWCSDGPGEAEAGGSLEIALSHWADATHAQGGHVVIPHLPSPNGEPATLIATGRVDAVEMLRQQNFPHMEYYRYLNGGYRLPLAGGTDKMSADVPVGLYRTYVRLPEGEDFDYDAWCRNMAAGRTYLSGGPLMELTVDGHEIGDTIRLPEGGGTVTVRACAESILPIHSLQIVQEGEIVAETREVAGARRLDLTADVRVTDDSWIAARTGGPSYFDAPAHHDGWHRNRFGHTSPVYVTTGEGDWSMWSDETARYMLTLIDGSIQYIRQRSTQYPNGHAAHHHGHHDHQAYLEEPFHQARQAIHHRMHALGIPH